MNENNSRTEAVGQTDGVGIGDRGWAAFLAVICLVILFANLGDAALFEPDEGRNAEKAREILVLNDWVTPHHNFLPTLDKPMGFYWPVALSFKVFGLTEWAARLPSALAALGCLLLVYRFARRQWGLTAALWSCLVLATSVEFFIFARLVIFDMSLTFFLSLALFSFYWATGAQDSRTRLFHSLVMFGAVGAGTLIKGPIAVVIPGMVVFIFLLVTRQWALLSRLCLLRGAVVFFVIVAPWYLWTEAKNPGYLSYFLLQEHFFRYLTPQFNRSAGWYYFFLVLAAGFLPWSLLLPQMAKNYWKRKFDEINLFLSLWTILPFIFFSLSSSKLPHYILPIYPALALLMGRFIAVRIRDAGSKPWGVVAAPWLLVILTLAYFFLGAIWPGILAAPIRAAAAKNFISLGLYGALVLAVFGIYAAGHRKSAWRDWGAAYLCTATGLAFFCIVIGQMMATASAERTAKPLAQVSAPFIGPGDRVGFYDTYLTGIAFYLAADRPLWLAQQEEKNRIMGSNYLAVFRPEAAAGQGQVVFPFSEFATQWKRKDLILRVFVKEKNLKRMSDDVGAEPIVLTKFDEYLLVTNR
ncbi:MAG: glycosyltransferase family 39 protein [Deltaproteobacteria bacterium]|nr:glycosyltransferase family 39 protein [Deltaproteobacteria bacterium]